MKDLFIETRVQCWDEIRVFVRFIDTLGTFKQIRRQWFYLILEIFSITFRVFVLVWLLVWKKKFNQYMKFPERRKSTENSNVTP